MHRRKALEERTGRAKAWMPSRKKREMYEETRIAVFHGGLL
jgi:hypothetical protein